MTNVMATKMSNQLGLAPRGTSLEHNQNLAVQKREEEANHSLEKAVTSNSMNMLTIKAYRRGSNSRNNLTEKRRKDSLRTTRKVIPSQ